MSTYNTITANDNADQTSSGNSSSIGVTVFTFSSSQWQYGGFRFQSITIPQGATILTAYLSFFIAATKNAHSGSCSIDCVSSTNAPAFTATTNGLSGLTLTGSPATWSYTYPGSGNQYVQTGSLVTPVQTIVNQGGWSSGNSIAFITYSPASSMAIEIQTYAGVPADAPTFTVTYSAGGNSGGLTTTFNRSCVLCPTFNTSVGLYDPKTGL